MKTLIEKYIDLFNKGLNNWSAKDKSEAERIYYELASFWGYDKASQMLKNARIEAIKKKG